MDEQSLYDLRKKRSKEFDRVSDLSLFLGDLLGEGLILPVVVGGNDMSDESWHVENLSPLKVTTELTIRSYLECLKGIEQGGDHNRFSGIVFYSGLESLQYSCWDSHMLGVRLREKDAGDSLRAQSFNLDFYFSKAEDLVVRYLRHGYAVASELPETALEKACGKFVGPDNHYQDILG